MHFADFDIAAFLCDHWQRQPLLIRNPWADWRNPLAPDELAGLACEAAIESRLVSRARGKLACEDGPFDEARFGKLGRKNWTLLVQAVDHHVPAVAALIEPFRFVPNWRIDDVMVSYAVDGGGVGAHFDNYDVFLIQGLGQRRWRVGQACNDASALLPHDELRLLADFVPTAEYLLEPGDILYVPPGIAHEGVAVGDDCMTYSVGFRAPARGELIADWADDITADMADDDRYADPGLPVQDNPGEITPEALAALRQLIVGKLEDGAGFARWFGRYTTLPKYPDMDWAPEEPIDPADLGEGAVLYRNPASRFSFVREGDGVWLFVDGESYDCGRSAAAFAELICARNEVTIDAKMVADASALIVELYNRGGVSFELA